MAIEKDDNELLTLEIIHRYVELLDKYFGSVSKTTHKFQQSDCNGSLQSARQQGMQAIPVSQHSTSVSLHGTLVSLNSTSVGP